MHAHPEHAGIPTSRHALRSGKRRHRRLRIAAQAGLLVAVVFGASGFAVTHRPVTLDLNGQISTISSWGSNVGDLLADHGIIVTSGDIVTPGLGAKVPGGGKITVTTVAGSATSGAAAQALQLATASSAGSARAVTETEAIPFSQQTVQDPTLPKGQTTVTPGKNGEQVVSYIEETVNGVTTKKALGSLISAEPVAQVTTVGTGTDSTSSLAVLSASVNVAPGSAQAIAQQMLAARGWGSDQMSCLVNLWDHESGWQVTSLNPYSGAYGIPQALPASKMASAGADWRTNPATQISWGLGYISGRYGTPCGAWAHELSSNWY